MTVIEFRDVSKKFRFNTGGNAMLKEAFLNLFSSSGRTDEFWALRNVSFRIQKGEIVGVIGRNGSGKSTVIKIISNVYTPTSGHVTCNGKVSALVELTAGFHPDLTGIENVFLNGAILGLTRNEVKTKLPGILEFADIGKFVDMQVKHYSVGMFARLGFAIAVSVEADVLLVDEVLAVGDMHFQQKCIEKILQLNEKGTTVVFVSHALNDVRRLCSRVLWIDGGLLRMDDDPARVLDAFASETDKVI